MKGIFTFILFSTNKSTPISVEITKQLGSRWSFVLEQFDFSAQKQILERWANTRQFKHFLLFQGFSLGGGHQQIVRLRFTNIGQLNRLAYFFSLVLEPRFVAPLYVQVMRHFVRPTQFFLFFRQFRTLFFLSQPQLKILVLCLLLTLLTTQVQMITDTPGVSLIRLLANKV